jgi:thioredoxin reductase
MSFQLIPRRRHDVRYQNGRKSRHHPIVGGGNCGLDEGLFVTQFARHFRVIENSDRLAGSRLLQDEVLSHPQMNVLSFNA